MKVRIVGKSLVNFTDEETGEVINGMNLYYYAPKDETEGFYAGKLWIGKKSDFYSKLLTLDVSKPLMAELKYDVQPGARVKVVLETIQILDEKDFGVPVKAAS